MMRRTLSTEDFRMETIWKSRIKNIILCVLFLCLFVKTFMFLTYLFRDTDTDRLRILGLKQEKELDMIYVGSSSSICYWQPLKAWNDCGFTSYTFATNSLQADSSEYYIREAMRTQDPTLFVVELRSYVAWSDEVYDLGLRNGSDSMSLFSPVRWKYIHDYMQKRTDTEEVDVGSFYFDIAKYHTNTERLGDDEQWKYSNNKADFPNKGWEWFEQYDYMEEPQGFLTDERGEVPVKCREALESLLAYCDEKQIDVLFVVSPKVLDQEEQSIYNSLKDIVENRGYQYLNANEHYEEMELDFSKDFFNGNHTNCFGAEKYTQFLEDYIVEHYDMPNHSKEQDFAQWSEEYKRFAEEEKTCKEAVVKMQENYSERLKIAERVRQTEDFAQWYVMIDDASYTLLLAQEGTGMSANSFEDRKVLQTWGITGSSKDSIRVVCDSEVVFSNAEGKETVYEGSIDRPLWQLTWSYAIDNTDGKASVMVSGEEYSRGEEGINIVVLDHETGRVADSVTVRVAESGLVLVR